MSDPGPETQDPVRRTQDPANVFGPSAALRIFSAFLLIVHGINEFENVNKQLSKLGISRKKICWLRFFTTRGCGLGHLIGTAWSIMT